MKTMIVVYGNGQTGKTTAIKAVYELLKKAINREPVRYEINDVHFDIMAEFEYNGSRIGIRSAGDSGSYLKEKLDELGNNNCKVILTACTCMANEEAKEEKMKEVVIAAAKKHHYKLVWTSHYSYDHLNNVDNDDRKVPVEEQSTAILPNGFDLNKQFAPGMVGLILELLK